MGIFIVLLGHIGAAENLQDYRRCLPAGSKPFSRCHGITTRDSRGSNTSILVAIPCWLPTDLFLCGTVHRCAILVCIFGGRMSDQCIHTRRVLVQPTVDFQA